MELRASRESLRSVDGDRRLRIGALEQAGHYAQERPELVNARPRPLGRTLRWFTRSDLGSSFARRDGAWNLAHILRFVDATERTHRVTRGQIAEFTFWHWVVLARRRSATESLSPAGAWASGRRLLRPR